MTDEEIVRLCAEQVMGGIPFLDTAHPLSPADPQRVRDGVFSYWNPLTSDRDNAALLDKMAADGWLWCLGTNGRKVFADFWKDGLSTYEQYYGTDRRRAICLAALRAKGVEVGE